MNLGVVERWIESFSMGELWRGLESLLAEGQATDFFGSLNGRLDLRGFPFGEVLRWAEGEFGELPDFRFEDCTLQDIDLSGAVFDVAAGKGEIVQMDFLRVRLRNVKLSDIDLHRMRLWDCDVDGLNLDSSHLGYIGFLTRDLMSRNIRNLSMNEARLDSATFENSDINGFVAVRSRFEDVKFRNVNMTDCVVSVVFRESLFSSSNGQSVFQGVDLSGSTFKGVSFKNIDLRQTRMPAGVTVIPDAASFIHGALPVLKEIDDLESSIFVDVFNDLLSIMPRGRPVSMVYDPWDYRGKSLKRLQMMMVDLMSRQGLQ